jgi:hypothetical protein
MSPNWMALLERRFWCKSHKEGMYPPNCFGLAKGEFQHSYNRSLSISSSPLTFSSASQERTMGGLVDLLSRLD